MVLLNSVILAFASGTAALFWNSQETPESRVAEETKKAASKPKDQNPVYLDARRYHLLPKASIVTFVNPEFEGNLPPGSTKFMLTEVLERRGKTVYPLVSKPLTEDFPGYTNDPENLVQIQATNNCKKGKGSDKCEEGYMVVDKSTFDKSAKTKEASEDKKEKLKSEDDNVSQLSEEDLAN